MAKILTDYTAKALKDMEQGAMAALRINYRAMVDSMPRGRKNWLRLDAQRNPNHGYEVGYWMTVLKAVHDDVDGAQSLLRCMHLVGCKPPAYWDNPYDHGTDDRDSWERSFNDGRQTADNIIKETHNG